MQLNHKHKQPILEEAAEDNNHNLTFIHAMQTQRRRCLKMLVMPMSNGTSAERMTSILRYVQSHFFLLGRGQS